MASERGQITAWQTNYCVTTLFCTWCSESFWALLASHETPPRVHQIIPNNFWNNTSKKWYDDQEAYPNQVHHKKKLKKRCCRWSTSFTTKINDRAHPSSSKSSKIIKIPLFHLGVSRKRISEPWPGERRDFKRKMWGILQQNFEVGYSGDKFGEFHNLNCRIKLWGRYLRSVDIWTTTLLGENR